MGRNPGESPAQWCARATAQYLNAQQTVEVERRRVLRVRFVDVGDYPTSDEAYDAAVDALEDADNQRVEAAIALAREIRPS